MNQIVAKPGGKQAVRLVLNVLGGVPFAGGAIAGAGQLWGEKEQQKFNEVLADWATKTDDDVKILLVGLEELLSTPTKTRMVLLMGEILGDELATQFLSESDQFIPIALNPQTVIELDSYIENGWLNITPTHSIVQMGANNKVENNIEELKRPWGLGNTFDLTINGVYFEE